MGKYCLLSLSFVRITLNSKLSRNWHLTPFTNCWLTWANYGLSSWLYYLTHSKLPSINSNFISNKSHPPLSNFISLTFTSFCNIHGHLWAISTYDPCIQHMNALSSAPLCVLTTWMSMYLAHRLSQALLENNIAAPPRHQRQNNQLGIKMDFVPKVAILSDINSSCSPRWEILAWFESTTWLYSRPIM